MIFLKWVELQIFVVVLVCFKNSFSLKLEPFLVNRIDGIDNLMENETTASVDDHFLFEAKSLPDDLKLLPTLGNGHLGFTALSENVYMNGFYNGKAGLSHRASIPNFVKIFLADCLDGSCDYTLNVRRGFFKIKLITEQFIATHLIYAHRFHTRALVNQINIQRLNADGEIKLKLRRDLEPSHDELDSGPSTTKAEDLNFTKKETIWIDGVQFHLLRGHIKELENGDNVTVEASQERQLNGQQEEVSIMWNNVPDDITLAVDSNEVSLKFIMTVDPQEDRARQEMKDVFVISEKELLARHSNEWENFWNDFQVDGDGDDELIRAIISSIFYLTSSLPSERTNIDPYPFFGLSPTGLGRGGSDLTDYEGHNFWDTEMWMLPPVALIKPKWAAQLLHYRFLMLETAKNNAKAAGFKGAKFPWESAATGIEVIQPGFEYIAYYQHHITADISHGLKYFFSLTHDVNFMMSEGCELATEIAKFWEHRVTYNESEGLYDINNCMGPDESHDNVNNNGYTNVVAKHALTFGWFAGKLCKAADKNDQWLEIAEKIKVLYDHKLDYHPQYEGFEIGTEIKQADTILLGYPLMYPMKESTKLNDLKFYGNATNENGPAMSYSMTAINYLDVNDETGANEMLTKSFQLFIREPFNVWSEVIQSEDGATNFMTGAGGFLQTIFNGFFGIRIHLNHLEIKNPKLPLNLSNLRIRGFSYLNSKFQINLDNAGNFFNFYAMNDDLVFTVENNEPIVIVENATYEIPSNKSIFISSTVKPFGEDLVKKSIIN